MTATIQTTTRVMLVDDQQVVLWALQRMLADHYPSLEVVSAVTRKDEVLHEAVRSNPDVVVLNPHFCGDYGFVLIGDLMHEVDTNVVVLSDGKTDDRMDRAVLGGVKGVVDMDACQQQLPEAIRKVRDGELWINRKTSSRLLSELVHSRGSDGDSAEDRLQGKWRHLTPREQSILQLMAQMPGARNKQLANRLGISEHTLRNHLASIFGKLELCTRHELFGLVTRHAQWMLA